MISGRAVRGKGEGAHFVGLPGYRSQFISKLGIDPYLGTLNVKLSGVNLTRLLRIKSAGGIAVRGFRKGSATFGGVRCYMAEISGVRCALVIPERTTHTDTAEIISSERLWTRLGLSEGERVRVSVFL